MNSAIYFAENWKHCSKIIFKCVNSVVGPMNSTWTVREQCINSVFYVSVWAGLKVAFQPCVFMPFFFFLCMWTVKSLCRGQKTLFEHCSRTVYALFMGPTTLFTHLKIILLQCFQFSVSTTISSIQTDPLWSTFYLFIFIVH